MSDTDYKYDAVTYGRPVDSFYRKFTAGDIWCEVEHDGEGGYFFIVETPLQANQPQNPNRSTLVLRNSSWSSAPS